MIAGHQGYVLIQTDNYNIETSVTGLAIILIVTMVVLFAIEWLLRRLFRTGAHTRVWFAGRKRRRARKQTEQALLKLAEGDYQQVEKLMSKNADHAEQPVVNYLLAAEAAQQRGDEARANQHLERAAELAGNDTIPVEITRVRLQLARNENHAARHGVDKLLEVTRVTRKSCVWRSRPIFAPAHGVLYWISSHPWRKRTSAMKRIALCSNNRRG
nr:Porphyrin biosynthetic protein [Salmonella sp. NCTC 7297]